METVTVKVVYAFKPVDKTYVVYQTYKDGILSDTGAWVSEADLATNDEILAFAKTHTGAQTPNDPGIEVSLAS